MKPLKLMSRLCKVIATGTVTLLVAACYGVPLPPSGHSYFSLQAQDSANPPNPVPDIQVTLISTDGTSTIQGQTDQYGGLFFEYDTTESESILIEDIDGTANGGDFQSQTLPMSGDAKTVTLVPKTSD